MITSAEVRSPGSRRRLLWAGVLLFVVGAVAIALRFTGQSSPPPTPPLVPANPLEPEVTAFVERVREDVLKQPRSARAWGELGQAFLANDMEVESKVCFAEAERLDPANPRWPYYQGGSLLNQGDREAALPYLRRAVEGGALAEPDNVAPRLLLAETLLALGRLEEAEGHFRQVLREHTDDARAHYDLALLCTARQDWQASRTHLRACVGNPSAQQKACVQLAVVSQRLGEEANAEKFRQRANLLPPDREWSDPWGTEYLVWSVINKNRYRRAESLERAGQLREAAAVLFPMLKEYPNDYLPRVSLSKVLGQLGDYAGAERLLREALRLAPEKVQVHYYLSLVLFRQANEVARDGERSRAEQGYREAVQRAREALAIKPDYGFAHMVVGLSLKGLGQRAEALTALRQAVRCNPECAELHFYLGEMLAEDGRRSEGREQLEQAVRMGPPNAPWRPSALARLATSDADAKPPPTAQPSPKK